MTDKLTIEHHDSSRISERASSFLALRWVGLGERGSGGGDSDPAHPVNRSVQTVSIDVQFQGKTSEAGGGKHQNVYHCCLIRQGGLLAPWRLRNIGEKTHGTFITNIISVPVFL